MKILCVYQGSLAGMKLLAITTNMTGLIQLVIKINMALVTVQSLLNVINN